MAPCTGLAFSLPCCKKHREKERRDRGKERKERVPLQIIDTAVERGLDRGK